MLRTTGFGAHLAAVGTGHREFAADRRACLVNAAVHARVVQRYAPAVGIARHHRHALFVALGHVRRYGVFLEQHNGQAAAEGIATVAMHLFFPGHRVQERTTVTSSAAGRNGKTKGVDMAAPGGRRPDRVRTQERERSEPMDARAVSEAGRLEFGRNARMQRFCAAILQEAGKSRPGRVGAFRLAGGAVVSPSTIRTCAAGFRCRIARSRRSEFSGFRALRFRRAVEGDRFADQRLEHRGVHPAPSSSLRRWPYAGS